MYSRIKISLFFLIICFTVQGQNFYVIHYDCVTKLPANNMIDGKYVLTFSATEASCYNGGYSATDTEIFDKQLDLTLRGAIGDPEGMMVYTDLKANTQHYKTTYAAYDQPFIFKEPIPDMKWEILDEQREIGNYSTIAALGQYGGRTYKVWFAPEIIAPFGPYRLGGLPGVILEARSTDGFVNFKFAKLTAIDTSMAKENIHAPRYGNPINEAEFLQFVTRKLEKIEALSRDGGTVTLSDKPTNTYLENDRWNYYTRIKKARGY